MKYFWVAVDGPAAAGKSTIARMIARRLSIGYLDTGAMYRAVAWACLKQSGAPLECSVKQALRGFHFSLEGSTLLFNGAPLDPSIRTLEVSDVTSRIACIPMVRKALVGVQQSLAAQRSLVMDGRDVGTVVLPNAQVKVFLTASLEERACRRRRELVKQGVSVPSQEELQEDIRNRDERDTLREVAPLFPAADAVVLDTTDRTVETLVDEIVELCSSVRWLSR
ncbi:(d)CMP kinase [Pasteuria penetrans]|uniref:(d)CMP kinase n=1 Tax=Pasteuria penetrans TaxID=86005 RepID=UPI0011EE0C8E|nr:(d)CMP kinase [Pasteuria penetrans]